MAKAEFILSAVEQGVATITLNRPDVLNSFNRRMAEELLEALAVAGRDADIRAVMLSGAGRGFCAGQDLSEATAGVRNSMDLGEIVKTRYVPIVRAIREMEKPVVCAVNGVAAGAGANLALKMRERDKDLRIILMVDQFPVQDALKGVSRAV